MPRQISQIEPCEVQGLILWSGVGVDSNNVGEADGVLARIFPEFEGWVGWSGFGGKPLVNKFWLRIRDQVKRHTQSLVCLPQYGVPKSLSPMHSTPHMAPDAAKRRIAEYQSHLYSVAEAPPDR